VKKFYRRL